MRKWVEFAAAWLILKLLGGLPRLLARRIAAGIAAILFAMLPKLRKTADFNLRLAFPEWDDATRSNVIRRMVRNLGWMAAEFARLAAEIGLIAFSIAFGRWLTAENTESFGQIAEAALAELLSSVTTLGEISTTD